MKQITLIVFSLFLYFSVFGQTVCSPDKNIKIDFSWDVHNGIKSLCYSVQYKAERIILESSLGINCRKTSRAVDMQRLKEISRIAKDTIWNPLYGERSKIRDHYNGIEIAVEDTSNNNVFHLQVRVYNEGIAFRYYIPEKEDGGEYLHFTSENTQFRMPEGTKVWFTPSAQAEYTCLPLNNWPSECERPLTMELSNNLFVCLTEAQMVNYSRTLFTIDKNKKNTIFCSMYGIVDEIAPIYTPWRVIMIAEKAGDLLQHNDLILNLNSESQLKETEWIKPGKVMREMSLSTNGSKKIVDFAVKRNLQYIHLDAGWYGFEYSIKSDARRVSTELGKRPSGGLDLLDVVNYANTKGIGVILYVNQRELTKHLDELLPLYQSWGIRGIKFGFVHVGSHRWTTWLHEAVEKCARYHLMVNIHDDYRPTGFSRTFPNLMTQEGLLGNEAMPDASHNCILPFTRFIAGPADYTICYYRQNTIHPGNKRVIKTTSAHQLALSVIFYSPLQWLYWYDKPKDCQDEPELDFFDRVPTVWKDTKVLTGEIGKYIAIARQSEDTWFMGVITGNEGRTLNIKLGFLDPSKKYIACIFSDGDDDIATRTKVKISRCLVDRETTLNIVLKNSGGQAIYFLPANLNDMKNIKKYNYENL